jgi:tRNA-specific 2-thiouridylase
MPKAEGGELLRAVDHSKDQSYVLHVLTQDKLAHALFPVGEYPKPEIRRLAADFGLPTASRADSQDLCFLAGEDYRGFLQRNAAEMLQAGEIETQDGKVIGEHNGLANYTIGQRKGLGVASPVPLYVIKKNGQSNALVVGTQDELGVTEIIARDVNWMNGEVPSEPFRAEVKIRYTAKEVSRRWSAHWKGIRRRLSLMRLFGMPQQVRRQFSIKGSECSAAELLQ